jgi:acetylornithine deacetylase
MDYLAIARQVDSFKEELVSFLQEIVRLPSLPGHEQAVQRRIAEKMRSLGLEVTIALSRREDLEHHPAFNDDGIAFDERVNVVGLWRGSNGSSEVGTGRSLIFNGHVDVVPPGNETLWAESPWSGTVTNGRLYGRGSCDMKAGVVSFLFGCQALKQLGFRPAANILFETVIGEESGGVGTLTTIVRGYTADAVIIAEPTRLQICPVQSGALTFRLTVPGRAIHACMKKYGVSAVQKFFVLFRAIEELDHARHAAYRNSLFDEADNVAPISIGTVHAGDWISTVPDELVAEGRFGIFPGESPEDARNAFRSTLQQAAHSDPWLREHPPTLEWFEGQFESGTTAQSDPIVQTISACYREACGNDATLRGVTYGSDLRLFTNHAKVPTVLFGPGDVANAHTVDESVDLDEVIQGTKLMAFAAARWCGQALL